MKKALILIALFFLGCTTATTQTQQQADAPANPEFKNLQVLPRNISRDQLLTIMRSFTRGLGVRCNGCHVVTATEPEEKLDFPSDAKEEKRAARVMYQMVQQINGPWMERVEQAEHPERAAHAAAAEEAHAEPRVVCWTCHRGKLEPEAPPPPPQPRQPAQ